MTDILKPEVYKSNWTHPNAQHSSGIGGACCDRYAFKPVAIEGMLTVLKDLEFWTGYETKKQLTARIRRMITSLEKKESRIALC